MTQFLAVKSYGWEWQTEHGMSCVEAARALADQGFDVVVLANLIDPLPGGLQARQSDQDRPRPVGRPASRDYDDRAFRDALRLHGIRIFERAGLFFSPPYYWQHPDARPVDATGEVMHPQGWYVGLCPTHPGFLGERAARIEEVVASLQPDGLFLSFARFPAFWEQWLPHTSRAVIPEYCFCERCIATFEAWSGIDLGSGSTQQKAGSLLNELRNQWTDWKCSYVADAVRTVRQAAQERKADVEIMVNGLPFTSSDYSNAVEEICGQRLESLAVHSDLLEFMFYHQMVCREPATFIASKLREAGQRTTRRLVATVQVRPDYYGDPAYPGDCRSATIGREEYRRAFSSVAASQASGMMVLRWSDLLAAAASGSSVLHDLREFKDGLL